MELLESLVPSPEVVQHCRDLCASGYLLALDDFVDHPKWEPLLLEAAIPGCYQSAAARATSVAS